VAQIECWIIPSDIRLEFRNQQINRLKIVTLALYYVEVNYPDNNLLVYINAYWRAYDQLNCCPFVHDIQ